MYKGSTYVINRTYAYNLKFYYTYKYEQTLLIVLFT